MPVSTWLQKYFDSQWKKWDIKKKLQKIQGQVDPAFHHSFQQFHDRIISIVDGGDEHACDVVSWELDKVDAKLHTARRKHDMKKAASVIKAAE